VKPMLAVPNKNGNTTDGLSGWLADLKLDGLRCIAAWDGSTITLTNRNEIDITRQFPDVEVSLTKALTGFGPAVLDGELIADDNTFTSIATRGKQQKPTDIVTSMRRFPARFVQFDTMVVDGIDVTSLPLHRRREFLFPGVDRVLSSNDARLMFEHVKKAGLEGIIAKDPNGRYHYGKRFPGWVKVKAVQTVTCIATGYEPGKGARAHFGAMFLHLIDGSTAVDVGRVGTGFTESEIQWLKTELDSGRPVVVEIETLNRTADNKLRFPVYLGVRTDLSVLDATVKQLDSLPVC